MNKIQNNRYLATKTCFKCDMAHYLRVGIHKCIWILKYKRLIMATAAISAIFHVTWAIASPNGWTFYENNLAIKYTEIVFSIIVVAWFLKDIVFEIKRISDGYKKVSYDPWV